PSFSHVLDDWPVTNQKQSGRCWCFAGLNLLRAGAIQALNLKDFEFSQNYTLFWDKYERANYFLECMIEMVDRDVDDRTVAYMLAHPIDDGGQWNMFVNIVAKHGLVPKEAMPESESSSCTRRMNESLESLLRQAARDLRAASARGEGEDELRSHKDDILETIWRVLAIHLGTPPEEILWQWTDKDKVFHRDGVMTPVEFAKKYAGVNVEEYVCIVNDPRESSPYGKTFTVDRLGNVVGGAMVKYLNVTSDVMKQLTRDEIVQHQRPVWMGCDVGKMLNNDLGYWDAQLLDFEGVYDAQFKMDKAARLEHGDTLMTHAMLFTGVDVLEDGTIRRWRVENSWGDERGSKGYYTMNDSWFEEHMFEVAVPKSSLPAELQEALEEEPIVLPAWDPMGALANGS
ncbi:MAG: C1 family peptidase, partial [Planctomycetota bacterium]